MKTLKLILLLTILLFSLSCSIFDNKAKYKEDIFLALKNNKPEAESLKSFKMEDLKQYNEISLSNAESLKVKKRFTVWKTLIYTNSNEARIFFVFMNEVSNTFFSRAYPWPGNSQNPSLGNIYSEEAVIERFNHITGVELNDGDEYVWAVEEYTFPADSKPAGSVEESVASVNEHKIQAGKEVVRFFGNGLIVIYNAENNTLKFTNLMSGNNILHKKGDKPITFKDYLNFAEGRIVKLTVQ